MKFIFLIFNYVRTQKKGKVIIQLCIWMKPCQTLNNYVVNGVLCQNKTRSVGQHATEWKVKTWPTDKCHPKSWLFPRNFPSSGTRSGLHSTWALTEAVSLCLISKCKWIDTTIHQIQSIREHSGKWSQSDLGSIKWTPCDCCISKRKCVKQTVFFREKFGIFSGRLSRKKLQRNCHARKTLRLRYFFENR